MTRPGALAPVAVRILSCPTYLSVVRAATERFCVAVGFDSKSAQQIGLALDEALANVIKHGYEGRQDQPIHIEFQLLPAGGDGEGAGQMRICVRDFGRQVDTSQIVSRDLDDIRPGGLGVHIMRSVMDEVSFRRRGLTGMELEMIKQVRPAERDAERACDGAAEQQEPTA